MQIAGTQIFFCAMLKKIDKPSFLLVFIIGCLLQACYTVRLTQTTQKHTQQLLEPLHFTYLTINASIKYTQGTTKYNLRVQFRMHKDHIIWFSAALPWGIEVARGMITPTQVKLMNHLQHTYTVYDYPTLQAQLHGPCSYNLIQAILLGELPAIPNKNKILQAGQHITIQWPQGQWQAIATMNRTTRQVEKMVITDPLTQNQCMVAYKNWKQYQCGLLFRDAQLCVGNFIVGITHKSIHSTHKKLNFPFTIPCKYVQK